MKKLFQLILLLALAFPAFAQNYPVHMWGQVTDTNGQPMEGLTVLVVVPALNPNGNYYSGVAYTDAAGGYSHSFQMPNEITSAEVHVALLDCDSNLVQDVELISPSNTNMFVNNFTWCAPQTGDCTASLTVDYLPGGTALVTGSVSGTGPVYVGFNFQDPAWTSLSAMSMTTTVTTSGLWCVYVEDADGCTNSACQYVQIGTGCDVYISYDSIGTTTFLTAIAEGTAPFTYLWSNGETTQSTLFLGWGINYCVTVTDATGCSVSDCAFGFNNCSAFISASAAGGLTASGNGNQPLTYLWDNGSTAQSIQPNAPGNYCVTVVDANGCEANDCYWFGSFPDSCSVYISYDSLGTGDYFTAIANGTAPFSYSWNLGQNTQSIPLDPTYFGDYCVTVTDAEGCESVDCIWGNVPCNAWILQADSAGMTGLFAIATMPNASYLWSNGSTDDAIFPTSSGTYCVTVSGGGCTFTACHQFNYNVNIAGQIYLPDSTFAVVLEGIVELYSYDLTTGTWNLAETVEILNDPNGWWNKFDFGAQNAGDFIIKATLDPSSPYAADYLPTYHFSTVHWDEASIISLPIGASGLYSIVLNDGQNLVNGSGSINGTVTEGDGFTANDDDDRGGTPRPNTSVLLFDANEQPITHTVTDDNGQYSFTNLPFGTYKLMVEIVGIEQAEKWVTLTANNPTSNGNDFQVTTIGIVLGIAEMLENSSLQVSPNPTASELNIWLESNVNLEAQISVARLDGTKVLSQKSQLTKGSQRIKLDVEGLPSGLYLVQVASGSGIAAAKFVKN